MAVAIRHVGPVGYVVVLWLEVEMEIVDRVLLVLEAEEVDAPVELESTELVDEVLLELETEVSVVEVALETEAVLNVVPKVTSACTVIRIDA